MIGFLKWAIVLRTYACPIQLNPTCLNELVYHDVVSSLAACW
jgi:hypothetical protein